MIPDRVAIAFYVAAYALGTTYYVIQAKSARRGEEVATWLRWALMVGCLACASVGLVLWMRWAMGLGMFGATGWTIIGICLAALNALFIAPQLAAGMAAWIVHQIMGEREESLPEMPQLDAARAAMKKQDWATAEARLRDLLAARPDHHDARAELAEALEKQGRRTEAAAELERAGMEASEPDRAAGRVFRAAEWWVAAGRPDLARRALEKFAERVAGTRHEKYARDRMAAL